MLSPLTLRQRAKFHRPIDGESPAIGRPEAGVGTSGPLAQFVCLASQPTSLFNHQLVRLS